MSSPRGGSSRANVPDSREEDHPQDAQAPPSSSERGSRHSPESCSWKTSSFHDQECSRFFDCPSHVVERKLSVDAHAQPGDDGVTAEGGTSANADVASVQNHEADSAIPSIENLHISTDSSNRQADAGGHDEATVNSSSNPSPAPSRSASPSPTPRSPTAEIREDTPHVASRRPPSQHEAEQQSVQETMAGPSDTSVAQRLPAVTPAVNREYSHSITSSLNSASSQQDNRRFSQSSPRASLSVHGRRSISTVPSIPQRHDSLPSPSRLHVSSGHGQSTASRPQPQTQREAHLEQPAAYLQSPSGAAGSPLTLPRWQPDGQATYCPICRTQFSFFIRKHHCRRCGRVVCNSCSPHRIIIPHQYIVRPPGSDYSMPSNLMVDGLGSSYFDGNGMSGGERVRLCNPCVPDPNTAPPLSPPTPSASAPPRSSHHRSRSGMASAFGTPPATNRYGAVFTAGGGTGDPLQYYASRSRSITMNPSSQGSVPGAAGHPLSNTFAPQPTPFFNYFSSSPESSQNAASSSTRRRTPRRRHPVQRPRQIAEEDECPVCHRELPSRSLPNFESLREAHINTCIQTHSTYGSSAPRGDAGPPPPARRSGMYTYVATEKDCVDDAECTICLEEFTVGAQMARLECLCRFHRSCIAAWFVKHPGRCPVHQHDAFGF